MFLLRSGWTTIRICDRVTPCNSIDFLDPASPHAVTLHRTPSRFTEHHHASPDTVTLHCASSRFTVRHHASLCIVTLRRTSSRFTVHRHASPYVIFTVHRHASPCVPTLHCPSSASQGFGIVRVVKSRRRTSRQIGS